jgi:hypothetical protein
MEKTGVFTNFYLKEIRETTCLWWRFFYLSAKALVSIDLPTLAQVNIDLHAWLKSI